MQRRGCTGFNFWVHLSTRDKMALPGDPKLVNN